MKEPKAINHIRRGFYLDSVALMRLSQQVSALPGVDAAAMMIGTDSNKGVLDEAGLLTEEGRSVGANDLIIAFKVADGASGRSALDEAEKLLDSPSLRGGGGDDWFPKTLDTAIGALPGANLALISVPGEFAAAESRKALQNGLHVMLFSDNVSIADELSLKLEAKERGLLFMGPDCGTAIIGGVPLAFANEVPRGDVGIVSAAGTGLQEVSSLIARGGGGVSNGIGVGGRDLSEAVGGIMTLMAIDALDEDPATRRIILISKPPSEKIAVLIFERIEKSSKKFTICFLGLDTQGLPANARSVSTLTAAAEDVLGRKISRPPSVEDAAHAAAQSHETERTLIRGLYSGGTLCAEAQVIFLSKGETLYSNTPVLGARGLDEANDNIHSIFDLGSDEYTVGRPHPMIDPSLRNDLLSRCLVEPRVAVILMDVVIGHGAHADPAAQIAETIRGVSGRKANVVASVCGTEEDPQTYSSQVEKLESAGIIVAPSNAIAAEVALGISRPRF